MERLDRDRIVDLLRLRTDTEGEAMRAYYAGAIESHCLQNAIGLPDLERVARMAGYEIDWTPALLENATRV